MKKLILSSILVLGLAAAASAQGDLFNPMNPTTYGQGGSYTANAEGYNAFFYNPAGFARKNDFTLASVNLYALMDATLFNTMLGVLTAPSAGTPALGRSRDAASDAQNMLAGLGLPQSAIDALTPLVTTVSDLQTYLSDVNDAAAAATTPVDTTAMYNQIFTDFAADPAVATILSNAGISVSDLTDTSSGADLASTLTALVPALLSDPTAIGTLVDTFITTVQSDSSDAITSAGGTPPSLPISLTDVGAKITDNLKAAFPSGNAEVGAMIGVGWVGSGLGIGLFADANAKLTTPPDGTILSAEGRIGTTLTLVAGVGFNIWDGFSVGISVRPTFFGYSRVDASNLMGLVMGGTGSGGTDSILASIFSQGAYRAFRLGVDAGALLDLGPFTFGLALKDIIPYPPVYYGYTINTAADLVNYLSDIVYFNEGIYGTAVPDQSALETGPTFKLNLGVQFHPDLGVVSKIIDPRVSVDLLDALNFAFMTPAELANYDFLDVLSFGASVKLLGFATISAGYTARTVTAGLGIHLLFLDVNAAVAAKDLDTTTGTFSQIGGSVEVAIRFN